MTTILQILAGGYVAGVLLSAGALKAHAKYGGFELATEDAVFESLAWPKYIAFGLIWIWRKVRGD